jgi:DNA-binding PadR family transcriptional regulator
VSTPRLTDTSYAVLGLVERCEPVTPYQLKQVAQVSILHFWSIPHTQIYTECARLADAGLLEEQREESGRRRRVYTLSERGRDVLDRWREEPSTEIYELRDPGLLKLFCGADPARLAESQLEQHERRLELYLGLHAHEEMPDSMRLALEGGIGHEREYLKFWRRLRDGEPSGGGRQSSNSPA